MEHSRDYPSQDLVQVIYISRTRNRVELGGLSTTKYTRYPHGKRSSFPDVEETGLVEMWLGRIASSPRTSDSHWGSFCSRTTKQAKNERKCRLVTSVSMVPTGWRGENSAIQQIEQPQISRYGPGPLESRQLHSFVLTSCRKPGEIEVKFEERQWALNAR